MLRFRGSKFWTWVVSLWMALWMGSRIPPFALQSHGRYSPSLIPAIPHSLLDDVGTSTLNPKLWPHSENLSFFVPTSEEASLLRSAPVAKLSSGRVRWPRAVTAIKVGTLRAYKRGAGFGEPRINLELELGSYRGD